MIPDDDLAGALPPPPPPRPLRRDVAIDAAMARFDGKLVAPSAAAPDVDRRQGRYRPQIAGLVTAALIGLVSVPLWMSGIYRHPATEAATANAVSQDPKLAVADVAPEPSPTPPMPAATADEVMEPPAAMVAPPAAVAAPSRRSQDAASRRTSADSRTENAETPPPPPPAPMPAPPPPVAARAAPSMNLVADRVAPTGDSASRINGDQDIVVTSARVASPPPGDWNACTIDDPRRDPARCKRSAHAGRDAAAGLALGWQHDYDGAIAAFDRAIAATPRSAFAYLNRGLAYARRGDLPRALADVDRAVRLRPDAAQGYYQRARILRRRGEDARAAADERRAAALERRGATAIDSGE